MLQESCLGASIEPGAMLCSCCNKRQKQQWKWGQRGKHGAGDIMEKLP